MNHPVFTPPVHYNLTLHGAELILIKEFIRIIYVISLYRYLNRRILQLH
jgi:hypothetical protein